MTTTDDASEQGCSGQRDSDLCPIAKDKETKVDRDSWLNTRILKIIGIVYGLASPFVVWLVVTIYNHNTQFAITALQIEAIKEQQAADRKVYMKMDEFKDALNNMERTFTSSMSKMQTDITIIKIKGNIQ